MLAHAVAEVVGHAPDIQQIHGRHVVGGSTAAYRAAAQREGGEEGRGEADAALRGGGVDQNSGDGLLQAEFADYVLIVGVDGQRMAYAAVMQQSMTEFAGLMPVVDHIEAEKRGELFLGEGEFGAYALHGLKKVATAMTMETGFAYTAINGFLRMVK